MPDPTVARTGATEKPTLDPRHTSMSARELEELTDRVCLDAILAKYGPATVVEWIGQLCRDRRPRS